MAYSIIQRILNGDGTEEPEFEADWLSVKSNRSVVMMLFDMEARKFKDDLYKEEEKEVALKE